MVKAPGPSRKAPKGPAPSAAATAPLAVSRVTWPRNMVIHRIHQEKYAADQFNPGLVGNARFSPIEDASGKPIPTLYGGASFDCAVLETIFHDVPFAAGLKTLDMAKLAGQMHSTVVPGSDLVLADLRSKALRKLGIARNQLIDTEKDQYPLTRVWAEEIYRQCADVQGLCWTSRQDDSVQALMLFGNRVKTNVLQQTGTSRHLFRDLTAYADVLALAEQIGVEIVPGCMPGGL